jgi:hypothetical protein
LTGRGETNLGPDPVPSFRRKPESVRLQAGAIGEVKVLSQEMPASDS